jgi:DNA modification methylase
MTDDTTLDDLPQPEFEGAVAPEELHTDGDNPNEMTDAQFGLLVDRMAENGWLGGPIITDADGLIADGEHRWRAAQENDLAEVPVKQYAIDDATRRLWRQELNKIHGEHDAKRDALEYDHLLSNGKTEEVEALTAAADEDLDELLAELRMDSGVGPAYEYDPEHNVYFEDCVAGMRERLDDDSVDMVFTSPPYNVEKTQSGTRESETVDYEDDRTPEEFREFLGTVFSEVARVIKPDGHLFINLDHNTQDGTVDPSSWILDRVPIPCRSYIVWKKDQYHRPHLPKSGQFQTDWEPIYHFCPTEDELNERKAPSVWDVPHAANEGRHEYGEHPAPFSVALVEEAIRHTTTEGDTILDPFMGSGTTAVAAIQNDRDYIGFELDEEGAYQPIIERRIGEAKRQREASVNQDD